MTTALATSFLSHPHNGDVTSDSFVRAYTRVRDARPRVIGVTRIVRDSLAFCCPQRNARAWVPSTRVRPSSRVVVSHRYSRNGIKVTKLEGADGLLARFLSRRHACERCRLIHAVAFHARATRTLLHHAETLFEISLRTFRDFPAPIRPDPYGNSRVHRAPLFSIGQSCPDNQVALSEGWRENDWYSGKRSRVDFLHTLRRYGHFRRCVSVAFLCRWSKNGPNTNIDAQVDDRSCLWAFTFHNSGKIVKFVQTFR